MRNKLLILLLGLLLALPVLAWGQLPDPRDSIIIESKTVEGGLVGTPASPAVEILVYTTNKDSLSYMVLNMRLTTISGAGFALLSKTAGGLLTFGSIVRTLSPFGLSFNTAAVTGVSDTSPDSFLVAGGGDGVDPGTNWPPNAARTPVWAIKFRATSVGSGQMLMSPTARVSAQPGSYFTNTRAIDVSANLLDGIMTIEFPVIVNPPPDNDHDGYNEVPGAGAGSPVVFAFSSVTCSGFTVQAGDPGNIVDLGGGNFEYHAIGTLCPGNYQIDINDNCGTAGNQPLRIEFDVTPVTPAINGVANAQIQANAPYSAQATASGGVPGYTFALVSGPAGLTVSPSGLVEWTPTSADVGGHDVTISARDNCYPGDPEGQKTFRLTVVLGEAFKLVIDTVRANLGADVNVPIRNEVDATDPNIANGKSVGGFSFLVSYDCGALTFLSATKGALLVNQGWEFFTYRLGTCQVRLTGIADVNNGAAHPNLTRVNQGEWVVMHFRAINDVAFAGQCAPISWYWNDCTDNSVSDSTGNTLWVVSSLTSSTGSPIALNTGFGSDVSNCDTYSGPLGTPRKFIHYRNGHVCIPTADAQSSADRGDINLNGLKYEVADANLFESYFIYGLGVFSSIPANRARQIAATDVNGDAQTLTIADLVMMVRIITHDMMPLPRMNPAAGVVSLALNSFGSQLTLSANSASDLGGLYLKFRVEGEVGTVALSGAASGMTVKSNFVDGELSVLIYSETKGQMIAPNAGAILKMDVDGSAELVESEAADYYGFALPTLTKASVLPTAFGLSQNYPNPFNGRTSFVLALPVSSDYTVTVYNVAGQVVRTFEGSAPAGNRTIVWDGNDNSGRSVSSGVYFFKAVAGNFSAVKKGLYLK